MVVLADALKLVIAPALFEFHRGLNVVLVFDVLVLIPLKVVLLPPILKVVLGLH